MWVVMIPQLNLGQDLSGQRISTLISSNLVLKSILHLLGMHLSFSYRKNSFFTLFILFSKKQSKDLDGLQTHDPVPKLDRNLKLRGPPGTPVTLGEMRVDQVS